VYLTPTVVVARATKYLVANVLLILN